MTEKDNGATGAMSASGGLKAGRRIRGDASTIKRVERTSDLSKAIGRFLYLRSRRVDRAHLGPSGSAPRRRAAASSRGVRSP
jgi:hypothetical protein